MRPDTQSFGAQGHLSPARTSLPVGAEILTVESEGFHDSKGGEGVVSGVEKLNGREVWSGPVARCDPLRFSEALLEHGSDGCANADLPFVSAFSEDVIEVEDSAERDAQTGSNLSTIVS